MTPREQLIEAIADKRCRMASINPGGLPGQYEGARPRFAESADLTLQALSDLGAVVLLPVKASTLKEGDEFVTRFHEVVEVSHGDVYSKGPGGNFFTTAGADDLPDHTVYINALESEPA
jgi:hypothetical protein